MDDAQIHLPNELKLPANHAACYGFCMIFIEIEQEAKALSRKQRATLVAALLDTLPAPGTDVSDEEVARRERELESGAVAAISHGEFVRRVTKARGR